MIRLPSYEEIRFRDPPLRRVLCQIKFPTILSLADGGALLGSFQEAIREHYPFLQQLQQFSVTISGAESSAPRAMSQGAWQFADPARQWTITLAPDALTLETERYSSFEDLSVQIGLALRALVEHVRPGYSTRVGLRYINEIAVNAPDMEDWSKLLNEHWRSILDAGIVGDSVAHWIQNLRLQLEDGTFNVNVGFIPDEAARVIIDLDYFDESQVALSVEDTMAKLDRWHEVIHNMFRWSISGEMLARLEAK